MKKKMKVYITDLTILLIIKCGPYLLNKADIVAISYRNVNWDSILTQAALNRPPVRF